MDNVDIIFLTITVALTALPTRYGKTLAEILRERRVTVRGRTPIIPPETSGRWARPSTREVSNWIDLVRAAAAAACLAYIWGSQRPQDAPEFDVELIAWLLPTVGILIQSFRFLRSKTVTIVSPVYYASAIVFACVDPVVSGFVVGFTWLFTLIAQRGLLFLPVMSITLGLAIYLTEGVDVGPIIFAMSLMAGPIAAVLFHRSSVIACRIHYR